MNKFYSFSFAMLFIVGNSFSQCEIDYDFGDLGFGVSPDAQLGETFANGEVGQDYYDVLHILVPESAADVDPVYPPTLPVDSLTVDFITFQDTTNWDEYSIEELGLEIVCNNNGDSGIPCSFLGGEQYCVSLQGAPTMAGVFQINIHVLGYINIFGVVEVPFTFSNFILNVHCNLIEEPVITDANSDDGTLGSVDITFLDGINVTSYEWINSDGIVVGNTEDIDGLDPGVYTLVVITDACTSYYENIIIADSAIDCSGLNASYVITDEIPDVSMGSIDLTVTGANGDPSFVWTDDATGITIGTDEDLTNVAAGDYTVVITDEDGCILILPDLTVNVNSVEDVELNNFNLSPNPANNVVSINLETAMLSSLEVRDARGRLVHSDQIIKNSVLDTSTWKEGIYFFTISNDLGNITSRLVIQR